MPGRVTVSTCQSAPADRLEIPERLHHRRLPGASNGSRTRKCKSSEARRRARDRADFMSETWSARMRTNMPTTRQHTSHTVEGAYMQHGCAPACAVGKQIARIASHPARKRRSAASLTWNPRRLMSTMSPTAMRTFLPILPQMWHMRFTPSKQ